MVQWVNACFTNMRYDLDPQPAWVRTGEWQQVPVSPVLGRWIQQGQVYWPVCLASLRWAPGSVREPRRGEWVRLWLLASMHACVDIRSLTSHSQTPHTHTFGSREFRSIHVHSKCYTSVLFQNFLNILHWNMHAFLPVPSSPAAYKHCYVFFLYGLYLLGRASALGLKHVLFCFVFLYFFLR